MKLSHEVRSTHNQDGAVVLDLRAGRMFRLNLVGSRILELLRAGKSQQEIVETIAVEFATEQATVAADVTEFLQHLERHRLLQDRQKENPVSFSDDSKL
jgi:hypothetical protein